MHDEHDTAQRNAPGMRRDSLLAGLVLGRNGRPGRQHADDILAHANYNDEPQPAVIATVNSLVDTSKVIELERIDPDKLPAKTAYRFAKRLFDIVSCSLALVVCAIPMCVIAVLVKRDSPGPVFYRQKRLGYMGREIEIVKFRSMRNTTDERGELLPPSQRVTRWGKFVRETSLDEFLNFWAVFKGDMSIIGPRPLPPEYEHRYSNRHRMRLAVRPGLECPPRVAMDHVRTWNDQFENDIWYVENVSLATDIMMCWNLVRFAFDRKSVEARARVTTRGTFMGYDMSGTAINLDGVPDEYLDDPSLLEIDEVYGQV